MIGQYLSQTNKNATVPKSKIFSELNKALASLSLAFSCRRAKRGELTSRWCMCSSAQSRAERCHRHKCGQQADPRQSSRAVVAAHGSIELPCSGAQASRRSRVVSPGNPATTWPASLFFNLCYCISCYMLLQQPFVIVVRLCCNNTIFIVFQLLQSIVCTSMSGVVALSCVLCCSVKCTGADCGDELAVDGFARGWQDEG